MDEFAPAYPDDGSEIFYIYGSKGKFASCYQKRGYLPALSPQPKVLRKGSPAPLVVRFYQVKVPTKWEEEYPY